MSVSLFKIKGGKELQRKLEKLPLRIQNKIIRKELKEAAKPIAASAKAILDETAGPNTRYSTVGIAAETSPHPGYLKKSIGVFAPRRTRKSKGRLTVQIGPKSKLFTGKTFYAGYKEFGHRVGRLRKGIAKHSEADKRLAVPAEPFLMPAFDRHATQIAHALPARIAARIEQEAKKK